MFRRNVRRSGSLRSIWHRRDRKRKPVESLTLPGLVPAHRPTNRNGPSEADWLSGHPWSMIQCLGQLAADRRVEWYYTAEQIARKLCLFYCGCCRLRWDSLAGDQARQAVAVIERHADGRANLLQWQSARQYAAAAERATRRRWGWGNTPEQRNAASLASLVASAAKPRGGLHGGVIRSGCPVEVPTQVALLRDLFDNPFSPTAVNPEWFTTTVVGVARTIYATRSFDSMNVLGDALQDTGCDCPHVLDHCYGSGLHSRGCWLLDAVLGNAS